MNFMALSSRSDAKRNRKLSGVLFEAMLRHETASSSVTGGVEIYLGAVQDFGSWVK